MNEVGESRPGPTLDNDLYSSAALHLEYAAREEITAAFDTVRLIRWASDALRDAYSAGLRDGYAQGVHDRHNGSKPGDRA